MARWLTASKLGLLALIELYAEGVVPRQAIVPVLSFITSHMLERDPIPISSDRSTRWSKAERTVSLVISIKDFEKLLGSYPFLMGMPGRKLWDRFLGKLWDINSVDALHIFIDNLSHMLAKTKQQLREEQGGGTPEPEPGIKFTKNSMFGAFIRRAQLEHVRVHWEGTTNLWQDYVRYRQPTIDYMKKKNPNFTRMRFDNVLFMGEQEGWDSQQVFELASVAYGDMLTGSNIAPIPVSKDDIDTLLEFQIEQMQKYGNRIPLEIRHQFHDFLDDAHTVPSLRHYLSFLDSWRAGDYPTAFDLLHRYFDYTMQNRDRLFYQYALMNLAVLQADFGCYKEAVAAMLETVSTARENRDMTCLNFALNWLFHFGQAHPTLVRHLEANSMLGTSKESLAFLRVKAKETGMWTLWSSVLVSEAKLGLESGDSVATALEFMVRSSQIIVEKNMKNMFGTQLSLTTSIWDRLGVTYMSTLTCEMFLRCHAQNSVFDDELKLTCRLAQALMERGKYQEALQKLERLDSNSLRSWKPNQYWHKYRGIIKLKMDLRHNNLDGAEQLLDQLLQSRHDDLDPQLSFMVDLLHLDYLSRRGDLQTAFEKVDSMLSKLKDENKDMALRISLLLWKVQLLDKCGRPQRGFTIAMRAASVAWRARLIPYLWQSMGAIGNILVSLGEFRAASQLLISIIPRVLEYDVAELAGQLYSYLADAYMGLAGRQQALIRMQHMTAALGALEKASYYYNMISDAYRMSELAAKKAVIMRLMGEKAAVGRRAAEYVALRRLAERLSLGDGA